MRRRPSTPKSKGPAMSPLHCSAAARAIAAIASSVSATPAPPVAQPVSGWVAQPAPGFYRFRLGDFRVTVLSDGNRELTRAAGLSSRAPHLFLGECSARYALMLRHAVIEEIAIEPDVENLACTRPVEFAEI